MPLPLDNQTADTLTFQVSEEEHGTRLDKFLNTWLQTHHSELTFSRERLKQLITQGCVLIDGKPTLKASATLKANQTGTFNIPETQPLDLLAEDIPLDIVFEDEHLLVINKPRDMLTHPNGKVQTGTLVNALLHHCGNSLSGINGIERPGIVHRLDRDTSGLIMVAKHDQAHQHLSEQLKERSLKRTYQALVQGIPKQTSGTITTYVKRHPVQRDKMRIVTGSEKTSTARHATTHWEVISSASDKISLVQLNLETGRTHQIRLHLSHLGHPVIGDTMYGKGIENALKQHVQGFKTQGQLLQATRIAFTHPKSEEPMSFEIPLNEDMATCWQQLQHHYSGI